MKTSRTWHLTVLLLKEKITAFEDGLKEPDKLMKYKLTPSLPFRGCLYVRPPSKKGPRWVNFIDKWVTPDLYVADNVNNSACLFLEVKSRFFVFTFGHGRNLLQKDAYVTDFGLKVTLNSVDADKLRTVDIKTIEELTVHTRRQTSRASSLETFGLDVSRDLLGAVTGEPKNKALAKRLTGADSLAFSAELEILDLGKKCEELLVAYESNSYKERFHWIDNLRAERDSSKIAELDQRLLISLKGDSDNVYLAAPELIDWEKVEGFKFSNQSNGRLSVDLDLDNYLNSFWENVLTVERLKKHKVEVYFNDQIDSVIRWSVYDCLVYETAISEVSYVLTGGNWFKVAKEFSQEIDDYLISATQNDCAFPDARNNEKEPAYNQRLAGMWGIAAALLDGSDKLVKRIEVCDLFTAKKQFIHIKRKNRSSTLSHLFAQGSVSGELFFRDTQFRQGAKKRVATIQPTLAPLIPDDQPITREFEVTYAIILKNTKKWPLSLPFFSRLHFKQASERLRALGYNVKLCPIKIS